LIERLPEGPGAYVLHGEGNRPLVVGAAGNLKLHVLNYFRMDRASEKALEYSHRITNITWRATRGKLGAQLHAAVLDGEAFAIGKRKRQTGAFTWQFSPELTPSVRIVPLSDGQMPRATESFGIFASERKARNALVRFAAKFSLCHCLLGIAGSATAICPACPVDQAASPCVDKLGRKRQLMRVFAAIKPSEVPVWPYRGPVGIRERSELHIVHHWQFLGTAESEVALHALLESAPRDFDSRLYLLLRRTLSRLPPVKIVDLSLYGTGPVCSASVPADIQD
jgi:DNA polymerase-3 subunit epsilon